MADDFTCVISVFQRENVGAVLAIVRKNCKENGIVSIMPSSPTEIGTTNVTLAMVCRFDKAIAISPDGAGSCVYRGVERSQMKP